MLKERQATKWETKHEQSNEKSFISNEMRNKRLIAKWENFYK